MIRKATSDDLPQLEPLVRDGCAGIGRDAETRMATIWGAISSAILDGQTIYVAQEGTSLVGVCGWVSYPGRPETVVGAGTFVHPAFHRRGIGRALRAMAESHWTAQGAREVLASVSTTNAPGFKSLQAQGFEVCGLEMRKRLPRQGGAG